MLDAIQREKQLKNWHREWTISLIELINLGWKDLSEDFYSDPETSSG
jgi:putative endonuclease